MKRYLWLILGALVAVVALSWYFFAPSHERVVVDLVKEFPNAKKKQPRPEVFSVVDAKVGDVTKPAIFVQEPSRLTYEVTVPDNGWLKVSLGVKEEAWTTVGDGVYFFVGVSEGAHYETLATQVVNPYGNPADRKWQDLMLDLSQYAGQTVDVIFNTRSSPPTPPRDDRNGDLALWGAPEIVVR